MKYIIFLLLFVSKGFSQNNLKDTLYFKLDPDYIVEKQLLKHNERQYFIPDIYADVKQRMTKSNSLGYFIFYRDTLYQSSEFENPLTLHEFIEKKENYYPGKHNRSINLSKLKHKFLRKYEIFFVDKNEVIKPKYIDYRSYYPVRISKENFIPNPNMDSLYFAFNEKDFYDPYSRSNLFKTSFGIAIKSNEDGIVLEKIDSVHINNKVETKSIIEFINYLKQNQHKEGVRSHEDIAEYLGNYKVFILKDQVFYEVRPSYWIE